MGENIGKSSYFNLPDMLNLCGIVAAILKMTTVEIFQCRESIQDIIIYPHIKL